MTKNNIIISEERSFVETWKMEEEKEEADDPMIRWCYVSSSSSSSSWWNVMTTTITVPPSHILVADSFIHGLQNTIQT